MGTDTTLDSGLCTQGNCANMYSVHGGVIVDNMDVFQEKRRKKRKEGKNGEKKEKRNKKEKKKRKKEEKQ